MKAPPGYISIGSYHKGRMNFIVAQGNIIGKAYEWKTKKGRNGIQAQSN